MKKNPNNLRLVSNTKQAGKPLPAKPNKQKTVVGKSKISTANPKTSNKNSKKFSHTQSDYKFRNYFESEKQLKKITHKSDPEDIVAAYSRLIWVCACNHVREGVEIEDLVAEGQAGVCEAIVDYAKKKKRTYNFQQFCLYKIRTSIFQYCLRNANQMKTPYYIQRGCMHVGQIFKLMSNHSVAEKILGKKGPATEQEIIAFIHNDKERLPLKSMKFIKKQITKDPKTDEFKQILSGVLNHELGSRHSYVKNNLTDVGKILHIKEKLWYTASSNHMNYNRIIDLILSARRSKVEFTPSIPSIYNSYSHRLDSEILKKELIAHGKKVCGELEFNVFIQNKLYDKNYEEVSKLLNIKKSEVVEIIKQCLKILRKDELFQQMFNEME